MSMKHGSIAEQISDLNRRGTCTANIDTFGCACPDCLRAVGELVEKLFDSTQTNQP